MKKPWQRKLAGASDSQAPIAAQVWGYETGRQ